MTNQGQRDEVLEDLYSVYMAGKEEKIKELEEAEPWRMFN